MSEKHYHIWRLSRTCTAWFFTQGWKIPDTTRTTPANQFDHRYEAERLVAQREAQPRDLGRYTDLQPPGMPIWVVEVKGSARSSDLDGHSPFDYSYAMATVDAISGTVLSQSYLKKPLLVP